MKLIQPSFKIIPQEKGLEGIYKQIELAGRTCYKSEDKITEDSAKGFVDRMINSGHGAMLEHGTVYLFCDNGILEVGDIGRCGNISKLSHNKYSKSKWLDNGLYITTNYRVLVENNWLDTLKYLCEPTEYHEKRVTVKFITSIGISREFNKHRVNSIAEQSTRYCNYSKDKFGNELTFIKPHWIGDNLCGNYYDFFDILKNTPKDNYKKEEIIFLKHLLKDEKDYMNLIKLELKPQQARGILPLDTATELVHTAFISDWKHFFELRDDSHAHPDAQYLAHLVHEEFIKRNIL